MELQSSSADFDLSFIGFDEQNSEINSSGSYSSGIDISRTPPAFTLGSYEIGNMKRARGGSISGRLRSASVLEESGLINRSQKIILKDLIISGDEALQKALDLYEEGDNTLLRTLMERGVLNQPSSIDLLHDLDVGLLSVDFDKFHCPDLQIIDFDKNGEASSFPDIFFFDQKSDDGSVQATVSLNNDRAVLASSLNSECSITSAIFLSGHVSLAPTIDDAQGTADNFDNMSFSVTFEEDFSSLHEFSNKSTAANVKVESTVLGEMEQLLYEEQVYNLGSSATLKHSPESNHITDSCAVGPLAVHTPIHSNVPSDGESDARYEVNSSSYESRFSPQFHFSFTEDASLDMHSDIAVLGIPTLGAISKEIKQGKSVDDNIIGLSSNLLYRMNHSTDGNEFNERRLVGAYSPGSRRKRIEKFNQKRKQRVWTKTVKYDVRKNFADTRMRVKGRFVKKDDEALLREVMALC